VKLSQQVQSCPLTVRHLLLQSFSAAHLILAGCTVLLSPGCAWHLGVPPKGEALPSTVTLESSPSKTTSASLSKLRFKALLLDGNGNLFLESGEEVRVRVEVVNTGSSPIQNASASLTGTPSVIEQFPSTTLTIPPLQPGETKSLEFVATLPSSLQPQQVEIRVSVTESGGAAARRQTLLFIIQAAGAGADGLDQIPAPVSDFHQPQTYAVSIRTSIYGDTHIASRPYASREHRHGLFT
jgi:CARDB